MFKRFFGCMMWAMLGLGSVGCVKGSTTTGPALVHPEFPYAVTYDDEKGRSVLGDEWRLENYRRRQRSEDIERKEGYELTYELDYDDDDKPDATKELPFPDLLFLHKRTSARLEVSTIILGERLANKELRVLLNSMVDSRSGTRSLLVGFGKAAVGVEKRFATRLVDVAEATLGEQKGIAATLERADLDQLQANPQTPWERSRLFMTHAPFQYVADEATSSDAGAPSWGHKYHPYRVLLVVEYTNTAEDFDAQYPEFIRLMGKTHLLTDAMLLEYLGRPLARCKRASTQAHLDLRISATGRASVTSASGVALTCARDVIGPYRFAGTGEPRTAAWDYDFTRTEAPAWLADVPYGETRPTAKPAAAPAPEGATEAPLAPTGAAATEPSGSSENTPPQPEPAPAPTP